MFVLLMASTLRDQTPSIFFEHPNELTELHLPIVPRLSAGPRPGWSDERDRRPGDEDLAVRAIPGSAHEESPGNRAFLLAEQATLRMLWQGLTL